MSNEHCNEHDYLRLIYYGFYQTKQKLIEETEINNSAVLLLLCSQF